MTLQIVYHGTNTEAKADSILLEGFRPGTYFSAHLEDALAYGGFFLFEVALDFPEPLNHWQVRFKELISPSAIVSLMTYHRSLWVDFPERRQKVFEDNLPPHLREPVDAEG